MQVKAYKTDDSSDHRPATGKLLVFSVADFGQNLCDEIKQLFQRMKASRLICCDMLHLALESPGLYIGLRSKLNNEGRPVLPSRCHERIIVGAPVVSHKPVVKLR